jgi:hypothetical protein
MLVDDIRIQMATRLISHSIHASTPISQRISIASAIVAMELYNTKHEAATCMPKKAIIGISHLLHRAKHYFQKTNQ